MRKLIWMMSVSLDGYMASPDGGLEWHRVDAELHQYFNDELKTMGAFLDGRVTYELMAEFWPTADQDPDCGPQIAEFAAIWREMPKIVYSRTLTTAAWNAQVVADVVPAEVEALKAETGGDLMLGGAQVAKAFIDHDLIDEYRVYVHPVVIGNGQPMFDGSDAVLDLELIETRTFGNGVVLLRYARARTTS